MTFGRFRSYTQTIKTLFLRDLTGKKAAMALFGSAILAFGLYHIHSHADITEGGVLGMTLLLQHWFGISPALSGFLMNGACYVLGWRFLGNGFIACSVVAGGGFSLFYALFEQFDPLWPQLSEYPAIASIAGALFVGIGVGLAVRAGGAPGGDDALSMALSAKINVPIQWVYLAGDLLVLGLSLTYLPLRKLLWSLVTVLLSGQLVGLVSRKRKTKRMRGAITPADGSQTDPD